MTNKNRAILKKALLESTLQEIKEIEAMHLPDFSVSPEFKANIFNHYVKKRPSLPKRVIISIIAAVITCTIIMMSISAIRTPIIDFIVDTFDGFAIFSVNDEETNDLSEEIEVVYSPLSSMIERGYTLKHHSRSSTGVIYILENENNAKIDISQSLMNTVISASVENDRYKETTIDHINIHYAIEHNLYVVYWIHNEYMFSITCDTSVSWDEIEKIIRDTIYSTPIPFSEYDNGN